MSLSYLERGKCLSAQPGTGLWFNGGLGPQQLDRDRPLQHQVHRPPHLAPTARAERLTQTVPAREHHTLAGHGSHCGRHRRGQGDNGRRHVQAGSPGATGQN